MWRCVPEKVGMALDWMIFMANTPFNVW
jgi:hypothetical protein